MALIKWGALVTDGRGKIGGQVLSKNRSGAYLRTKVSPVNPQTARQQASRQLLGDFSSAWRGLTDAQRAQWNAAVVNFEGTNVFGDTVRPTGKNLFTRLNINLALIGVASILVPPAPAPVESTGIASVNLAVTIPTAQINFTSEIATSGIIVSATTNLSPGVGFFKNKLRMIDGIAAPSAEDINVLTAYNAKFGGLEEGQKVAFQCVFVDPTTGMASAPVVASAIVAA